MFAVLATSACVATGCSAGGGSPVTSSADQELTARSNPAEQSGVQLWGYYDVFLDVENRSVEVVPNRSAEFAANVVKFLNNDPKGIGITFNGTAPGPGYVDVDLDVTIKHPLAQNQYDGYDVRGIFMGNGSATLDYNSDLVYPVNGADQVLLNADGYTRWFNPIEFYVPKIFGYIPGRLGSKGYAGSATLCPYKYFGEGLDAAGDLWTYLGLGDPNVGYFLAGTSRTRNYVIRFPLPLPGVKYGYAVVANWSGTAPQHHPSHAPEAVGVSIEDNSTLYYVDETHKGGNLILDISAFDWDAEPSAGVMEDYSIFVDSTVLSVAHEFTAGEMTPTASGNHWFTYHVEIPADNVTGTEGNEMWIVIEDSVADYTNPLGVPNSADGDKLAACFRFPLAVASEEPKWIHITEPNGGQQWKVGWSYDLGWKAHPDIQNVKIELSLNSGGDYTYVISDSTPNDGTFTWDPIPPEAAGDGCLIKISDEIDPAIYDESDADFTIYEPWIDVTSPNGGEYWGAGSTHEISWETSETVATVDIAYTTDDWNSEIYEIDAFAPNTGSYMWQIPSTLSDTAIVGITIWDPLTQDASDGYFTIAEGGWARTWGYSGVRANGVVADDDGNTYVTGLCWDGSAFLNEYDPAGMLVWEEKWGAEGSAEGRSIDKYGDYLYVVGDFAGTDVDFDPGPGVDLHSSGSGQAAFLCKFDIDGLYSWGRSWARPFGLCDAVEVEGTGIDVAGAFMGTDVDFDPSAGTDLHTSNGGLDAYLSSYNTSGDYLRTYTWGGPSMDRANDIAYTGIIVVAGFFYETVDFDPGAGTYNRTSTGNSDAFLSVFHSEIGWMEAYTWGGAEWDDAKAIAADASHALRVVGLFYGSDVDFDPGSGVSPHSSAGSRDAYVSYFTCAVEYSKTYTWGGTQSDAATSVAVDADGSVLVGGYFSGSWVDFDPGPDDEYHSSNGGTDAYWTQFNSFGDLSKSRSWGGMYADETSGVSVSGTSGQYRIFCAGIIGGPDDVEFASTGPPCNDESDTHTAVYEQEPFLVKYMPDGCW